MRSQMRMTRYVGGRDDTCCNTSLMLGCAAGQCHRQQSIHQDLWQFRGDIRCCGISDGFGVSPVYMIWPMADRLMARRRSFHSLTQALPARSVCEVLIQAFFHEVSSTASELTLTMLMNMTCNSSTGRVTYGIDEPSYRSI